MGGPDFAAEMDRKIRRFRRAGLPFAYLAFGAFAALAYAGDGSVRDFAGRPVARAICWREFVLDFGRENSPKCYFFAPWGFLYEFDGGISVAGFRYKSDVQYYRMWAGCHGFITRPSMWDKFQLWARLRETRGVMDGILE